MLQIFDNLWGIYGNQAKPFDIQRKEPSSK